MKNSEATKQPMLPDTSTCVVDYNDELSKDSVIDYATKIDEESVPIALRQSKGWGQRTFQNSLQENVELVS